MKQYQKAQMIAKNRPTGSYAAGCPQGQKVGTNSCIQPHGAPGGGQHSGPCYICEIAG